MRQQRTTPPAMAAALIRSNTTRSSIQSSSNVVNQPSHSNNSSMHAQRSIISLSSLDNQMNDHGDSSHRMSMNEKLASIGGLFGLLSLVITGILLYAIFTSKSQDKWWYVVAVLVNVSLLVLLMICAILFDRFYLKKYIFNSSQLINMHQNQRVINQRAHLRRLNRHQVPSQQSTVSYNRSSTSNRPAVPHNTIVENPEPTGGRSSDSQADMPPEYPGGQIKTLPTSVIVEEEKIKSTSSSSQPPPPDYFDLYPSESSDPADRSA